MPWDDVLNRASNPPPPRGTIKTQVMSRLGERCKICVRVCVGGGLFQKETLFGGMCKACFMMMVWFGFTILLLALYWAHAQPSSRWMIFHMESSYSQDINFQTSNDFNIQRRVVGNNTLYPRNKIKRRAHLNIKNLKLETWIIEKEWELHNYSFRNLVCVSPRWFCMHENQVRSITIVLMNRMTNCQLHWQMLFTPYT